MLQIAAVTQATQPDPGSCLFFARAPSDVTSEEVSTLFSHYGQVERVNIYRSWPSAKTSKGCGTVQFATRAAAAAALQGLHGTCPFIRAQAPLVVERLDTRKQKSPFAVTNTAAKDQAALKDQERAGSSSSSNKQGASIKPPAHGNNLIGSSSHSSTPRCSSQTALASQLLVNASFEMLSLSAPQATAVNGLSSSVNSCSSCTTAHPLAPQQQQQRRSWCGSMPAALPAAAASPPQDIPWSLLAGARQASWQQQQQQMPYHHPHQQQQQQQQQQMMQHMQQGLGQCDQHISMQQAGRLASQRRSSCPGVAAWALNGTSQQAPAAAAGCVAPAARQSWSGNAAAAGNFAPLQRCNSGSGGCRQTADQLLHLQQRLSGVPAITSTEAYYSVNSLPGYAAGLLSEPSVSPLFSSAVVSQQQQQQQQLNSYGTVVTDPVAAAGMGGVCWSGSAGAAAVGLPGPAFGGGFGVFGPAYQDRQPQTQRQPNEADDNAAAAAAAAAAAQSERAAFLATASLAMCDDTLTGSGQLLPPLLGSPTEQAAATSATGSAAPAFLHVPLQQQPLPQQQAQQQLELEMDQASWFMIAVEDSGWQSVARITGAQIQMQVQAHTPLLSLRLTGTATQVAMAGELIKLLLLREAA